MGLTALRFIRTSKLVSLKVQLLKALEDEANSEDGEISSIAEELEYWNNVDIMMRVSILDVLAYIRRQAYYRPCHRIPMVWVLFL